MCFSGVPEGRHQAALRAKVCEHALKIVLGPDVRVNLEGVVVVARAPRKATFRTETTDGVLTVVQVLQRY